MNSTRWRPPVVWCGVSLAAATGVAAMRDAVPDAWAVARGAHGPEAVTDVLVAVCATGLALALACLWVVTSATVLGLLAGRARTDVRAGTTRRLVLAACGVAVVAGTALPAHASGAGEGTELLVGLALPERAVAPPRAPRPAPPAHATSSGTYVVRPGDSLWSIARAHPHPTTSVDERWRAIWRANRAIVGDDPDHITPGQALRLPGTQPDTDGERR